MRTKLVAVVLAATAVLSGCAYQTDSRGDKAPNKSYAYYMDLPDGRKVICVYGGTDSGGGVTCDWANAK